MLYDLLKTETHAILWVKAYWHCPLGSFKFIGYKFIISFTLSTKIVSLKFSYCIVGRFDELSMTCQPYKLVLTINNLLANNLLADLLIYQTFPLYGITKMILINSLTFKISFLTVHAWFISELCVDYFVISTLV